ncbi:MAG: hypothetical protein AAGB00_00505 [Planctomycetota bacterium]
MKALVCFAVVALALPAAPCEAFWFQQRADSCGDACQQSATGADPIDHCVAGYKVNKRWPSPYVCPDRVYAHAPFDAMVRNGWRRQNLLGGHHFNEDSTKLTQAGELKVRWIMTQTPPQYRRIFVEQGLKTATTEARINTANVFAGNVTAGIGAAGAPPQIVATHIQSEGRPAATVDYVNSQFRENMRVPVLPASAGESGGGE